MDVILHIGAGLGGQLEEWLASGAQRIVLFEPHPGLAKRLTSACERQPSVSVVPVAIAAEAGACSLEEYNLPEANSLRAPTALNQLFPGLKHINDYPVQAITPQQMMTEYGPADNASASLVIEAPGEAHAILQPLMENDLLDRFAELHVSMTVAPCYEGSVSAEQTLDALSDYGFDVVRHDDQDPDWPDWMLQRNPLKVELKKLQHRLSEAEQEKAQAGQYSRQIEKQLAEQQEERKTLEQEYKKQQQVLGQAEEKIQKTHRYFMVRKQQALEGEKTIKALRAEYKRLEKANTGLQEELTALKAELSEKHNRPDAQDKEEPLGPLGVLSLNSTLELPKKESPQWHSISVLPGQKLVIRAAIEYRNIKVADNRKSVLLFRGLDSQGNELDSSWGNISRSRVFESHFKYLPDTQGQMRELHVFTVPEGITEIRLGLAQFRTSPKEQVLLKKLSVKPKLAFWRPDKPEAATAAASDTINHELPLTSTAPLIEQAQRLAKEKEAPLTPTAGRVAVVASQPWRARQPGYAQRVQQLASLFQANDWEALCMVGPFGAPSERQGKEPEALVDGVRYLHGQWPRGVAPTSAENAFITSVEMFVEWFKEYTPQVVVAADDFTSALPAIVAARQLSLPVIKEQLHYADAFLERPSHHLFERLEFTQKFAAEQACLALADGDYYLYPEAQGSWDGLQEVVKRVCGQAPQSPLAVLKPKARYTVKQLVEGEGLYYMELDVEDTVSGNAKGVVGSFRFLGSDGKPLPQRVEGFVSSKDFPHYQYVDTSATNGRQRVIVFQLPAGVRQVEVDVVAFVTKSTLTLHHASIGKVSIATVARWLSLKAPGVHWIKAVEAFVHKEGATSLRLALLHYKHQLSQHLNDQKQLNGAIQEMVELDRTWLPALADSEKPVSLKATKVLTVAHLHKTAYPYENTGGAIRCLNTALSQQRIGIDPYIITPIGYPRSVGIEGAKNYEMIEGIEHFRIGGNTDGLRGLSLPDRTSYSSFHLAKLIKERGANVIHAASGVRGYELALQALALKRLTGLPLLYEVRSFHEHTWTPVRNDAIELEKTQLRIIKEDFCMAEADFVTTISFSMQKILIERGVSPEKIAVIPNAIDEAKYLGKTFSPMPMPALEGAEMVVGYISNMSRREGHQYLIRAIHQLREQTGRDIRGLLVGNGPERENLEQLAAELGMAEVIAFPGEVDHSQINAYYMAIDLFVIPRISDYAADWVTPLKPYEAMALERPIIVTDLPALKEIVGDNEERGLVAKPADVDSMVEQLRRYIDEPTMRQRKVDTAREWVFQERTWSANAKRYDAIYRRLMEQRSASEQEALNA